MSTNVDSTTYHYTTSYRVYSIANTFEWSVPAKVDTSLRKSGVKSCNVHNVLWQGLLLAHKKYSEISNTTTSPADAWPAPYLCHPGTTGDRGYCNRFPSAKSPFTHGDPSLRFSQCSDITRSGFSGHRKLWHKNEPMICDSWLMQHSFKDGIVIACFCRALH